MAIRINVTAVRSCPPDEVRSVMSEVIRVACAGNECPPVGDQLDIHEHNGWVWFSTSVWGVSAGDLNRGLCKLARPALQFTTSDGDRWYLTVHGGPSGRNHFLHEFSVLAHVPDPAEDAERQAQLEQRDEPPPVDPELAFLEDDPIPGPARVKAPFDLVVDSLTSIGGSVAEEFRASVAHLPYSQALRQYREWHADQVIAALIAVGIPVDVPAVRSVLLWENISENESGSDLGNLPRLLAVLGLGGDWDEWIRQAEAPPLPGPEPEPVEYVPPEPQPPEDYVGPVLAIVEPLGLTPVAGGPVPLPLKDMTLIQFFPDAVSILDTANVAVMVTVPGSFEPPGKLPVDPSTPGQVELRPDGLRIGMLNHLWFRKRDLTNLLGKKLTRFLYHLPDGTTLDVAFALEGKPALTQRYRGTVMEEAWQIAETYPPLTHEVLTEALRIARSAGKAKFKARDAAEVDALLEVVSRDPQMWNMKFQRKGLTIWSESDIVPHLPKAVFRHRFKAFWDVAAHDREAARQREEHLALQRQMRQAGAAAARRRAAPHDDAILLDGTHGRYWQSDFSQLTELEQETRQKIDDQLANLGFTHIGDLVAKKQRDIVLRTYIARDGLSYAILMGKRTMYLGQEFFTRFGDDSTLTTTTNGAVNSHPQVGMYYKVCPGLDVPALFAKHVWGIERFRTRKSTEPAALDNSPLGVARELDAAFARRAKVEASG
ncbi:MAG TPA: hypothetical protein VHR66_02300 [Gemmataceae bacterium]|jgi:hypothetical protein|nr:hypothetical protein [Gemmataceae bacterium]